MRRMTWSRGRLHNLSNCIISQPPVAIFALCLASFCIVTFSLGIYVKHSPAPIKNPDELSWNDVGRKLGKLDFCLQPPEHVTPEARNLTGLASVTVAFEFDAALDLIWKNFSLVYGSVPSSNLGLEGPEPVNVSFVMSHMESQKQICMIFYHPEDLLMPNQVASCDPLRHNILPKSAGAFVIPKVDRIPAPEIPTCPENSKFNVKLGENPKWVVVLDQDDRSLISLHLMVTSLFLLLTFLTVLCFGVFRGGLTKPTKLDLSLMSEDDKELLNP